MTSLSTRIVGALVVIWTLGCALLPVHVGLEIGMPSTSCGPAVANLTGHGLSQYGPEIGKVCQDFAQDRLLLWLAYVVPLLAFGVVRLKSADRPLVEGETRDAPR